MSTAARRNSTIAPQPGTPAHLTAEDGTTLPVSVADVDEGILLVLLVDPGTLLDEHRDSIVLESITNRGLVRMHGTVSRIDSGTVRFWVEGSPEVVQRRQFVRVIAPQKVTLDDACGNELDTHSLNISGGGMLLSGTDDLDLGTEINFKLHLNEKEPPVVGLGRVVRSAGENYRAIVFEDISRADRERLIHFIFDRQRAALAVTRGDLV